MSGSGGTESRRARSGSPFAAAADYSTRWPRVEHCSAVSGLRGPHAEPADVQLSLLPLLAPNQPVAADEVEGFRQRLLPYICACRGQDAQLLLRVTDNRSTMISVRRWPGRYRLRLHRLFLTAGKNTLEALGRYVVQNERSASIELGRFIDAHQEQIAPRQPAPLRVPNIVHQGRHYNLKQLFDQLNDRYFAGSINARITWGRLPSRSKRPRRHSSLKLGSYSVEDRLIRIHRTLDHAAVPTFFIEWIIYHEMLHQKHPIPIVDGRRRFHTPAFMAEERLFEDHARACQWERRNLHRLLVY